MLLDEFNTGLDVEYLRELLRSPVSSIVRGGAWILSELGTMAAPLLDEVAVLLEHPDRGVRFDVLNVVLVNAEPKNGALIAQALRLLNDTDEAVRWKCLDVARRLSKEQLLSAQTACVDEKLQARLAWLSDNNETSGSLIERYSNGSAQERAFVLIAAGRKSLNHMSVLKFINESGNDEKGRLAGDMLEDVLWQTPKGSPN